MLVRLNQRKEAWECYGIIISGTSPFVEKYESTARRCHFNVLFETEVDETFENIKERQTKASEAFENKSFVSFKTDIYKNKADFLLFSCWDFFKKVLDSKEFIESVLLLIITATSLRTLSLSLDNLSLALSVVFAILILITNIVQVNKHLLRWSKNKKTNKKINMFQSMTYDEINEIVLKKLGNNYHPVAYAALKLHLENKIYDNLKED